MGNNASIALSSSGDSQSKKFLELTRKCAFGHRSLREISKSAKNIGDFVAQVDGWLTEFFSNFVVVLHIRRLPTQRLLKPLMARDVAQAVIEAMGITTSNIARELHAVTVH